MRHRTVARGDAEEMLHLRLMRAVHARRHVGRAPDAREHRIRAREEAVFPVPDHRRVGDIRRLVGVPPREARRQL